MDRSFAEKTSFYTKTAPGPLSRESDLLQRAYSLVSERPCRNSDLALRAADLLLEQAADDVAAACALLAPLLWEKVVSLEEIEARVGPQVYSELSNLRLAPVLPAFSPSPEGEKRLGELLHSFGINPRSAPVLIAFRLLDLESQERRGEEALKRKAKETLDVFVPIANRLGLGNLRRRLEDTCFKILEPEEYNRLKQVLAPIQAEDEKCLAIVLSGVRRLLENNEIEANVCGRTKSLYGIFCKMKRTGKPAEQILDRIGVRIIVNSVLDCYVVLGLLHFHFKPIPGTFNDYIGLPKENGYQSLHTCVYPVREISHKPIEFQIRTHLMHMEAEHGTAAHWSYKSGKNAMEQESINRRWIEGLSRQHEKAGSEKAFIEMLHRQVFSNQLVVFTTGGRTVGLPHGSTVREFLDITNTPLPDGASILVNGCVADIDYRLKDGDSIAFCTNENEQDPTGKRGAPYPFDLFLTDS